MKRLLVVWLCVVACGPMAERGLAQDPAEILQHFRLVPRLSRMHKTGGIAGVNERYRLTGEFDLSRSTASPSTASFENAEVWGSLISDLPTPAIVEDVDEIFNLEGLRGTQLLVDSPFDIYRFTGELPYDSSVELFAALAGPWMYLQGGTEPPPGSADYFEFDIRALARSRSRPFADFNADGVVDAADYVLARKSHLAGGEPETIGAGLAEWREQFGETVPDIAKMEGALSAAAASFAAATGVPEPACLTLAIGGGVLIAGLRHGRRK
jgi:hypothetical protein